MSKPTIAKLRASVNGGQYSPDSLRFEMDVNSFPMVTAGVVETDGQVTVSAPLTSDVLSHLGRLQQQRLAGRTDPDMIVEADDGIGGSILFSGFVSAPILELSRGNTTNKFSSVGKAAMLDAMDLSIYRAGYITERKETSSNDGENQLKPIPAAKDGDVAATLQQITDVLVSNFDVMLAGEHRELSKKILQMQHDINTQGPLDMWREILAASSVKFASWDIAFQKCPAIARQLTENVRHALEARTPGFWNIIRSLLSSFQMYYVPSFDGVGRFERADNRVKKTDSQIFVSASELSISDGSPRILPPGGVVMTGAATLAERLETQGSPRIMAFAPNPLIQGFIQQETIPFWLVRSKDGTPILGSEIDTKTGNPSSGPVDLALAKLRERKRKIAAYRYEVDTASEGIMTELCEVMFQNLQLEHATASITLPLEFSVNQHVGKRLSVEVLGNGQTGGSFEAFVSGVTHTVDLRAGKELNSFTQLRLSHAKFS